MLYLHGNPGRLEEIWWENVQREQNADAYAELKKVLLSNLIEQRGDSRESRISACMFLFSDSLDAN